MAGHFAKFGQARKLFWHCTGEQSKVVFHEKVTNVEIKKQPDGTSRGFAFVTFAEKELLSTILLYHREPQKSPESFHFGIGVR